MFYRKYFTGTISNGSTTKSVPTSFGISTTKTIYVNQTDVVLDALKETLEDCGCEVTIDKTDYITWINGIPLSITFTGATVLTAVYPLVTTNIFSASGTSYEPFSGNNYKFYITVKGDPTGIIDIYFGSYSSPATLNTTYSISLVKGKDNRDKSDVVFIGVARSTSMYVFGLGDKDVSFVNGKTGVYSCQLGLALSNDTDFTESGQKIPLVENVTPNGVFKLSGCFLGHPALTADSFYNIDGEVFYCRDNYVITQCPTIPT